MRKKKTVCMIMAMGLLLGGCGGASSQAESVLSSRSAGVLSDGDTGGEEEDRSGEASEKMTLRVGTNLALGTATPYVSRELGYFDDSAISMDLLEFSDGSALMEAFAADEMDIAFVGVAPVATWYARGVGLKIVAAANGGGHVLMTREDTGITSVADLAGKTVAEPGIGTVTDALLRDKILPSGGLTPDDITAVPGMKPADMASVLEVTREVDAMITWEPYAAQAEAAYDDIRVLYDSPAVIKEETGSDSFYPVNVVIAAQKLIDEHPEELAEFLDIYKKTVDYVNTDDSANAVLADILSLDESIVENARKRIDYNYEVDEQGIMDTLQWSYDLQYIDELPRAEELIDTSLLG
jgi:NitT/TauT family transport system substrate-binding protein